MASHWFELGIKLLNEDQESKLDLIKSDHPNDSEQCCRKMFWCWLETHPDASWQQLINSLRSPALKLHTVAANIEATFTGKYYNFGKKFMCKRHLCLILHVCIIINHALYIYVTLLY